MSRTVLISVFISMIFAGFEGAADAAGSDLEHSPDTTHEMHRSVHADDHDHADESDSDDHFCHCSAHAIALLPEAGTASPGETFVSSNLVDSRFTSLAGPPLLRPPNR